MAKREPAKTIQPLPVDAPARRRLPILLRHAWYGLNQAFRRRITHLGITPDQFTVMRTLLEGGDDGLMQRDLIKKMASDPNTIASLVDRMQRAGLLERETHEKDRRANLLRLLPVGRKKYLEARKIALSLQAEILSALPEDKREAFLEDLAQVAENCRTAAEKS
ncbi:MAG: transcriptional regulator, MarR family [Verrucomicrobiales bacterium]|nr:transcriptional regulator, MarR family [Verrucomicrobiales bacterium]